MLSTYIKAFHWTLRDDPFLDYFEFKPLWSSEHIIVTITEKPR